ncbi:hypothetical protein Tco_0913746 [Tanacetum coccineum]
MFTSSTTKVDSETSNGSNEDISNPHEWEKTLDVSACTLNLSAGLALQQHMASANNTPGLAPQRKESVLPGLKLTPGYINSGLVQNLVSSTPYVPPSKKDYGILFQPLFDEYFNPPPRAVSLDPVDVASQELLIQLVQLRQLPLINMYHLLVLHQQIKKFNLNSFFKLTKNHPLENVIGDPSRSVSTRSQLQEHAIWSYFDANDNPIPFGGKRSGSSEGSSTTPEVPDELKDNSAVVAEKQAGYVQDVQINPVQAVDDRLSVSKSSWIESKNNNALRKLVNETQLQQHESLVTESPTLEANLSMDVNALDVGFLTSKRHFKRSLEVLVGARKTETDKRLLQRTKRVNTYALSESTWLIADLEEQYHGPSEYAGITPPSHSKIPQRIVVSFLTVNNTLSIVTAHTELVILKRCQSAQLFPDNNKTKDGTIESRAHESSINRLGHYTNYLNIRVDAKVHTMKMEILLEPTSNKLLVGVISDVAAAGQDDDNYNPISRTSNSNQRHHYSLKDPTTTLLQH